MSNRWHYNLTEYSYASLGQASMCRKLLIKSTDIRIYVQSVFISASPRLACLREVLLGKFFQDVLDFGNIAGLVALA